MTEILCQPFSGSYGLWASLAPERTIRALLALAVRKGGRLAAFDRSIPLGAVVGATPESLAVIARVA
jgi:hypothetical protein